MYSFFCCVWLGWSLAAFVSTPSRFLLLHEDNTLREDSRRSLEKKKKKTKNQQTPRILQTWVQKLWQRDFTLIKNDHVQLSSLGRDRLSLARRLWVRDLFWSIKNSSHVVTFNPPYRKRRRLIHLPKIHRSQETLIKTHRKILNFKSLETFLVND